LEPSLESPSEPPLYLAKKKHTHTHTDKTYTDTSFAKRKSQYIILLQKCKRRKDPGPKQSLHFLILFSKFFYKRVRIQEPHAKLSPPKKELVE
jgi:hypothetical protein